MKKTKLLSTILAAAMLATGLAGCGETGGNTPGGNTPGGNTPGGNTPGTKETNYLNVMFSTNVISLDTYVATDGESFELIADCIDGLTQMDENGNAIPAIAKSWDISDDGCTYTFHLREDAKWSNGASVTADDFVFSWRRNCDNTSDYGYMFGTDIGAVKNGDAVANFEMDPSTLGVSAVDDYTFKVELEHPVAFFPALMYFPIFYPLNEDFYNSCAAGTYGTSADTFLANGAFTLESYGPSASVIKLLKNDKYYDASKVSLEGIKYQVLNDSQSALNSFLAKELDIVQISGDQIESVEDDPRLYVTGAGYMWYMTMNLTDNPDLANNNLRLALSNAINRVDIVNTAVKDGSLPTYTAVPPEFTTLPSGADFSADQTKFKAYCADDAVAAKSFYEKAKSELGKSSFSFELIIGNNEGAEVANVAALIKDQVEKTLSGVTINIVQMTKSERLSKLKSCDYELGLTRWGPDYADPMTYLTMWVEGCANNYGKWVNDTFNSIIDDCSAGEYPETDEGRWAAMYEAEAEIMKDAVIAPIYTKASANMIASGVSGVDFHPVALNRVYKNAKKA